MKRIERKVHEVGAVRSHLFVEGFTAASFHVLTHAAVLYMVRKKRATDLNTRQSPR
uniref:Uncharacterized protein n=1 Tax=Utricularia reniformis TaxID=192314 RepID=A0A1Y0AZ81_9LAMI|nr:hypothetical protein AEK19_MT2232 [Utricularia reniformis]ART30441.1 hypothetical protein AEK19_MT2232 [Utricularia reniformis]